MAAAPATITAWPCRSTPSATRSTSQLSGSPTGARSAWCGIGGGGVRRNGLSCRLPSPAPVPSSTPSSVRAATPITRTTRTLISSARTRETAAISASQRPMAVVQSPSFPAATLWELWQRRHCLFSAPVAKPIKAALFGRPLLLQERFAVAAFPVIILSRSGGFVEEVGDLGHVLLRAGHTGGGRWQLDL